MLDKKTFTIGCLSVSAVILLAANILAPHMANATYSNNQGNDYTMVTATAVGGGDAVYITEKRSGRMAVFEFDPNRRGLVNLEVQPVQRAFARLMKK